MACSDHPCHHPAGLDCALGWRRHRAYQARSLHPGRRLYLIGSRGHEPGSGLAVVARVVSHPHAATPRAAEPSSYTCNYAPEARPPRLNRRSSEATLVLLTNSEAAEYRPAWVRGQCRQPGRTPAECSAAMGEALDQLPPPWAAGLDYRKRSPPRSPTSSATPRSFAHGPAAPGNDLRGGRGQRSRSSCSVRHGRQCLPAGAGAHIEPSGARWRVLQRVLEGFVLFRIFAIGGHGGHSVVWRTDRPDLRDSTC